MFNTILPAKPIIFENPGLTPINLRQFLVNDHNDQYLSYIKLEQ